MIRPGRLPAAARWYLAACGWVLLLLVALHFANQQAAQQLAEQQVGRWLAAAGGEAHEVRYRLLRSTLSVRDIHLRRNDYGLTIRNAQLRLLPGDELRFDDVLADGVHLRLSGPRADQLLRQGVSEEMPFLHRLLSLSSRLIVRNGTLILDIPGQSPLRMEQVDLSYNQSNGRDLSLRANLFGGWVRLATTWPSPTAGGWQQSIGRVGWHNLDLVAVQRHFSLPAPMSARLEGEASWQPQKGGSRFVGEHYFLKMGGDQTRFSKSNFSGALQGDRWQLQAQSASLPLHALGIAPQLFGHTLSAGYFDGRLAADGSQQQSVRLDMDGHMHDLLLGDAASARSDPWRVGRAELRGGHLDLGKRTFLAEKISLTDADLPIAVSAMQFASGQPPWHLSLPTIAFDRLRLSLVGGGRPPLLLPPMRGEAIWSPEGNLQVSLATPRDAGEQWLLHLDKRTGEAQAAATIEAASVPLTRLRPLLPKLAGDRPSELAGAADLRLAAAIAPGRLALRGQGDFSQVSIGGGGHLWSADALHLDLLEVGFGVAKQRLGTIRANGWHFHSPLHPLQFTQLEAPLPRMSHDPEWVFSSLSLHAGSISAGRPDNLWCNDLDLDWAGAQQGGSVSVQGRSGGGYLTLDGRLLPDPLRFAGTLRLRTVSPLFLNEWFELSHMPRLLRGRLDGEVRFADSDTSGRYRGQLLLDLQLPQFEAGDFPDDPLQRRLSIPTGQLPLHLLRQGNAHFEMPLAGRWSATRPWRALAELGIAGLKQQALSAPRAVPAGARLSDEEIYLRLHDADDDFTFNERQRLQPLLQLLAAHPEGWIELQPRLGDRRLDEALLSSIRVTQSRLENLLVFSGAPRPRIFPIWPQQPAQPDPHLGIQLRFYLPGRNPG